MENPLPFGRIRRGRPETGTERRYDEHAIGDHCLASIHSGVNTNTEDLFNWVKDRLQFLKERRALREFKKGLQTGRESLATFSEGTEFDPNAYPTGTILNMVAQLDIYETKFPDSTNSDAYDTQLTTGEEWWDSQSNGHALGIVANIPSSHAKRVIQLPGEWNLVSIGRHKTEGHQLLESPYRIGDWRHQAWISGEFCTQLDRGLQLAPPVYFSQQLQDDIFYRVSQIDVLQLGRGDRLRKKVIFRKPSLFLGKQTETA